MVMPRFFSLRRIVDRFKAPEAGPPATASGNRRRQRRLAVVNVADGALMLTGLGPLEFGLAM